MKTGQVASAPMIVTIVTRTPLLSGLGSLALFLALLLQAAPASAADTIKLEAQLIWATNDEKSPNPKHTPSDASVAKKLGELVKWTRFFEDKADRKVFTIKAGETVRRKMSADCEIEVKYMGGNQVQMTTIGKKKPVNTQLQGLPKGELLVIGGPVENHSAWFVALRQVD